MMKEVCAQCLQKHVDPVTGQETIIFSCFNQDQVMDRVDFANLNARLRQNTVQEKLTNLWLEQVLRPRRAWRTRRAHGYGIMVRGRVTACEPCHCGWQAV